MSLRLQSLDARVAVCGQLSATDMAEVAAAGYSAVVNNRPDGEALMGQPRTAALKEAAERAGLVFLDLPFSGPNLRPEQVRAFRALLAGRDGKVLAFCKSGMRSALMWGTAALADGRPCEEVLDAARKAGQNLDPVADLMTNVAAQANS